MEIECRQVGIALCHRLALLAGNLLAQLHRLLAVGQRRSVVAFVLIRLAYLAQCGSYIAVFGSILLFGNAMSAVEIGQGTVVVSHENHQILPCLQLVFGVECVQFGAAGDMISGFAGLKTLHGDGKQRVEVIGQGACLLRGFGFGTCSFLQHTFGFFFFLLG